MVLGREWRTCRTWVRVLNLVITPLPHIITPSNDSLDRFIHLIHCTDHINKWHALCAPTNHEKKLKNFTDKTFIKFETLTLQKEWAHIDEMSCSPESTSSKFRS